MSAADELARGPVERAADAQGKASDPKVSAFVSASAGSGKTKLLTDRLLRLMLAGAAPEKIQCLTFTKAAAAEMALRLRKVLAEWVRLDDAGLDGKLRELQLTPDGTMRGRARGLFARVLDLPGGMRIGTIHAFCQSVLRRFPLEAMISPHFQLVDERDTDEALAKATEASLPRAPRLPDGRAALEQVASVLPLARFGKVVKALHGGRARLDGIREMDAGVVRSAVRRVLDVRVADEAELIANAVNWQGERDVRDAAHRMANEGSASFQAKAGEMLAWLDLDATERARLWEEWRFAFVLNDGKPRAPGAFANKKLAEARPELVTSFLSEQQRILDVEAARRDLRAAEFTAALLLLAAPLLGEHARAKDRAALLDYDDLIGHTEKLLREPGAAWVLYKLDGGLDHLLLDEVQDTAPAQWRIAGALTAEFFAGAGARDVNRTVFAVGDRKQSIYSFQGADPDAFDHWQSALGNRVRQAGGSWLDQTLDVSFRSTEPVLALVDTVFENKVAADGVLLEGKTLKHVAARAHEAGRVELLPLVEGDAEEAPEPWAVTRANRGQASARQKLAEGLAEWIKREIGHAMLSSEGRALTAGDVLVLVRGRRNGFADLLTRALKARGIPVGGLDRIVLTEQLAVQDLMALGDALLLPEDDLAFANMLVSPLGGLDHDSLEALAVTRTGSLRQALRERAGERADWRAAEDFFAALLGRVDFCSPFTLFTEALGHLGGRARIFARLGAEAEEPIAEFLQAALSYARLHPPSLQGFLHWLRKSGAEVKREQEEAGGAVRIMTVHGAKGLQAPLVILPDTTSLPPADEAVHWAADGDTEVPVLVPNGAYRGAVGEQLRATAVRRQMQEYNRQLYVALTRAQDRLVVCGWKGSKPVPDTSWYRLVEDGFSRLPEAGRGPFDLWEGEAAWLETARPVAGKPPKAAKETAAAPALPSWAGIAPDWRAPPPPEETGLPEPLAPSRPDGVELGHVPAAASPLAEREPAGSRFQRGKLVHALLQHLPDMAADRRRDAARAWLARPGQGIAPGQVDGLAGEVLAILDHPDLGGLFGPGSQAEVPLTGVVDGKVIGGLVDRLSVSPDRVLIADYKTNREQPATAAATPVLYLRQMAAYRAVLRAIFPGRAVGCVLIWTRSARAVMLPDELLDAHAPSVPLGTAPA